MALTNLADESVKGLEAPKILKEEASRKTIGNC